MSALWSWTGACEAARRPMLAPSLAGVKPNPPPRNNTRPPLHRPVDRRPTHPTTHPPGHQAHKCTQMHTRLLIMLIPRARLAPLKRGVRVTARVNRRRCRNHKKAGFVEYTSCVFSLWRHSRLRRKHMHTWMLTWERGAGDRQRLRESRAEFRPTYKRAGVLGFTGYARTPDVSSLGR